MILLLLWGSWAQTHQRHFAAARDYLKIPRASTGATCASLTFKDMKDAELQFDLRLNILDWWGPSDWIHPNFTLEGRPSLKNSTRAPATVTTK